MQLSHAHPKLPLTSKTPLLDACIADLARAFPKPEGLARHRERATELSSDLAEIAYSRGPLKGSVQCVGAFWRFLKEAPRVSSVGQLPQGCSCTPFLDGMWHVGVAVGCASVQLASDGLSLLYLTSDFPKLLCELNTIVEETEEEIQALIDECASCQPETLSTAASSGDLESLSLCSVDVLVW